MSTTDLDLDQLDQLAELLKGAGIRSVDVDPGAVNLPGCWIELVHVAADVLAGFTIRVNLVFLARDNDPRRAAGALQTMFNAAAPVIADLGGQAGNALFGTWVMPGSTTPLPGISVPLDASFTAD